MGWTVCPHHAPASVWRLVPLRALTPLRMLRCGVSQGFSHRLPSRSRKPELLDMKQQISVITPGVIDLDRAFRFYGQGFGWAPVFLTKTSSFPDERASSGAIPEGVSRWRHRRPTWDGRHGRPIWATDLGRVNAYAPAPMALAHNVAAEAAVAPLIAAAGRSRRDGAKGARRAVPRRVSRLYCRS